jgi:hypothetical protein
MVAVGRPEGAVDLTAVADTINPNQVAFLFLKNREIENKEEAVCGKRR